MIASNLCEGGPYGLVGLEIGLVHKAIEASTLEQSLDLAEDGLDWVELERVSYVQYALDVESIVPRLDVATLVNLQLVHQDSKRPILMLPPYFLQVLDEVCGCHCRHE